MNINLVGAGYWGSKVATAIENLGHHSTIIDVKNGQNINDIQNKDPVILATPLWEHYEDAKELLLSGHDVYVEKPMCETFYQTHNLASFKKPDQILMVGHIFLYHPHCQKLKKLINYGRFGKIKTVRTERLNWGIRQNRTTPALSLAPHDVSILHYLLDGQLDIDYYKYTNLSNNAVPDSLYFNGYINDVFCETTVSWYSPIRRRLVTVIGDKGCAIWDTDSETLTITDQHVDTNNRINKKFNSEIFGYTAKETPLELEIKHFVECCQNRTTPLSDVDNAMEVARVIDHFQTAV